VRTGGVSERRTWRARVIRRFIDTSNFTDARKTMERDVARIIALLSCSGPPADGFAIPGYITALDYPPPFLLIWG